MDIYSVNPGIEPDDHDRKIATSRTADRDRQNGRPRVGDFAKLADGRTLRFSHYWSGGFGGSMQVSEGGSFYLAADGLASFSGGCEPAIELTEFGAAVDLQPGHFWFFHHDRHRAHNAIGVKIPCRVYEQHIERSEDNAD